MDWWFSTIDLLPRTLTELSVEFSDSLNENEKSTAFNVFQIKKKKPRMCTGLRRDKMM